MRGSDSMETAVKVQCWCIFMKISWGTVSGKGEVKLLIVTELIIITSKTSKQLEK